MVNFKDPGGAEEQLFEALKRKIEEMTRGHNDAPIADLGGLSPNECDALLYTPWDADDCPIKVDKALPLAEFEKSPFFRRTRAFLIDLHESGGAKVTATGNLTRTSVASQFDNFYTAEEKEEIMAVCKVINEEDLFRLHISRVVSQTGKLIGRTKGKFQVRKNHLPLLQPERAGDLFSHLFHKFFRQFNIEYLSFYGQEFPGIQQRIAYSLYRLWSHDDRWIGQNELPNIALFEQDRREIEATIAGNEYQTLEMVAFRKLINPLEIWGFVETREEKDSRKLKEFVRPTPLFRKVVRFEFKG